MDGMNGMDGWDGWMDGRMREWMREWMMRGWMDGWMDKSRSYTSRPIRWLFDKTPSVEVVVIIETSAVQLIRSGTAPQLEYMGVIVV
jgi:hypothetical protein